MPGEIPNIPSRGPMPEGSDGNETPHIQLAMQYILEYAMSGSDRMQEVLDVANRIIHAPGHEDEEPNLLAEFATTIVQKKVPSRFIPAELTFDLPSGAPQELKEGVEAATRATIQGMLQMLVPFAVVASGLNELAREWNVSVYTLLGMSRIDPTPQNKEAAVQRILGRLGADFRVPLSSKSYSQDRIDARWVKRLPLGFDPMALSQYEKLVGEEAPAVLELGIQFMERVIEQQQAGNVVAADEDTSGSSALVAGLTPALILRHLDINAEKIIDGVDMVIAAVYLCIRDERRPDAPTGGAEPQGSPVPSGSPAGGGESGRVRPRRNV